MNRILGRAEATGTAASPSSHEARRVQVALTVALLGAAIALLSIPYDYEAAPWWMPVEDLATVLGCLAVYAAGRAGKHTTLKVGVLAVGNLTMLFNAAMMGRDAGPQMMLFAFAVLPFVFFGDDQRGLRRAGIAVSVGGFFALEAGGYDFVAARLPPYHNGDYYVYSALITFVILLVAVRHFVRANHAAESALREREARYRMITEAAPDAILNLDAQDRIIYANPASAQLFGRPTGELLGLALDAVLPVDGEGRTAVHPSRGNVPIEISVGVSQEMPGLRTLIVRDVTERVRSQQLLDETRARSLFAAKLAALGEMSSGIAHEINNPLAALTLASEALLRSVEEDDELDPEHVRYTAQRIQRITGRIDKIVNALRFFARDAARDPMTKTQVKQLVDDTLELCGERFRKHRIELRVQPVRTDLFLECRAVQVSQVLVNLLSNAHDAVEGQSGAWVAIEVTASDDEVRFAVTDSNRGIAEAIRDKIFQPFFTTKEIGKGTGLGLSVSHGIVADHAGRMELDLESAHTRFVVALPLRQDARDAEPCAVQNSETPEKGSPSAQIASVP